MEPDPLPHTLPTNSAPQYPQQDFVLRLTAGNLQTIEAMLDAVVTDRLKELGEQLAIPLSQLVKS